MVMVCLPYEVKVCDLCQCKCKREFVLGATRPYGLEGTMCTDCFRRYGLSPSLAHRYEKDIVNGEVVWKEIED